MMGWKTMGEENILATEVDENHSHIEDIVRRVFSLMDFEFD
jgi:hypothetical protein